MQQVLGPHRDHPRHRASQEHCKLPSRCAELLYQVQILSQRQHPVDSHFSIYNY